MHPAETPQRIGVDEAMRIILEHLPCWPAVQVPIEHTLGAVLREPVRAERDQPPFDRVTMDGIAISSRALAAGRREFRIAGVQGAGARAGRLDDDEQCIEVMTGGVLPEGADTVVPVERITVHEGRALLEPDHQPRAGQNIHRRGSDHRAGTEILPAGQRIGAPEMAILTIGGQAQVAVTRTPRIAVISTGDELVEAGKPIADFQIRSSNDRTLEAALRRRAFSEVTRTLLPDDPPVLEREISRLLDASDVLVLSGGVSMGRFDHVPATLAALGVQVLFHKVTQRPGLPLWFGCGAEGKLVFALPGNPVSSLVCLARYVVPALDAALGATAPSPVYLKLAEAVDFTPDLTLFLPVELCWHRDGEARALPRPTNTSGDFVALGGTDGFVELPRGQTRFPAGYAARFFGW